jgi:thiamine-monophosphate kinase
MNEFSLIHRYFAPLAGKAGLGLRDDAALFTPPSGKQLVITQDAMTAGVHFFADDPADLIARKLLRVNLSDLAAKGAEPLGYLLSLLLPVGTNEEWIAAFAKGLGQDQAEFGIELWGGDTSKINGPLTLSLTAIGAVETGKMIPRSGAKVGDHLYVTGTIGDAALGLKVRNSELPHNEFLLDRYLLPQPRFLATRHSSLITGCMDISDGLIQDAEHLAKTSGVKLLIEADKVPLSEAAISLSPLATRHSLLTGGDDYELLFTAPPHTPTGNYTLIGHVEAGEGVSVLDAKNNEITFAHKGWNHF